MPAHLDQAKEISSETLTLRKLAPELKSTGALRNLVMDLLRVTYCFYKLVLTEKHPEGRSL